MPDESEAEDDHNGDVEEGLAEVNTQQQEEPRGEKDRRCGVVSGADRIEDRENDDMNEAEEDNGGSHTVAQIASCAVQCAPSVTTHLDYSGGG